MKLAVVGAGAMGGALAVEAARAGHAVHVVDVSAELVGRVNEQGLRVHAGDSVITADLTATTEPSSVGVVDVVVVFVKAQHTQSAAKSVEQLRGDDTVIATLQNGWGNADVLAGELGPDNLVFGVTYNSCSVLELGVVRHSGRGDTFVGPYDANASLGPAETAGELLRTSGWATTVSPVVRAEIWKKLVLNCATLPTAALTGLTIGALGRSELMMPIVEGLAEETTAVARALGLDIDPAERIDRIKAVLANGGPGKASMLQDVEARRKTEIEVINAAVVRAAEKTSVPTPLNSLMVGLVAGLETSWRS